MGIHENTLLHSRLKNCLQTILELEDKLAETHLGPMLLTEFSILKGVFDKLEDVSVEEDDVKRIEEATSRFLLELKESLPDAQAVGSDHTRVLQ